MKQYIFWRDVNKQVREECIIEANSLDRQQKNIMRVIVIMLKLMR